MNVAADSTLRRPPTAVERLAEIVGGSAAGSRVFGAAVAHDGVTVVPVARARWGFGGGAGQAPGANGETGSGGGGGATIRPVGFIEIADGHAHFRRIGDPWAVAFCVLGITFVLFVSLRRRAADLQRVGGCARLRRTARETTHSIGSERTGQDDTPTTAPHAVVPSGENAQSMTRADRW